jgi:hypothetical protein
LALAGTLLCLSSGLWFSSHKALRDLDEVTTTIAMPDMFAIRQYARDYIVKNNITEWETEWGILSKDDGWSDDDAFNDALATQIEQDILKTMRDTVYPSGLVTMDGRRIFNGISPGVSSVSIRATGYGLDRQVADVSPQAMAAFIVTCTGIDDGYYVGYGDYAWDSRTQTVIPVQNAGSHIIRSYTASFRVDEMLHLHDAYGSMKPRSLQISIQRYTDGSFPVEKSKQYVVTGWYQAMGMQGYLTPAVPYTDSVAVDTGIITCEQDLADLKRELSTSSHLSWLSHYNIWEHMLPLQVKEYRIERPVDGESGYPIYALDGSVEAAVASEQGGPLNNALKRVEATVNSFPVLTTNDPNSFFKFNQRRNLLSDGRVFTAKEARNGAKVCLVSVKFAEANHLTVGDTLPLQLYNTVFGRLTQTVMFDGAPSVERSFWVPSTYHPDLEISEAVSYTVIGIYNSVTVDSGDYAIPPSTVIIPDRSFGSVEGVPVNRFYAPAHMPLLTDGLIVPNGGIEKTRAVIDGIADGYGNLFRFYDQGYVTLRTSLLNLRFAMAWVFALSGAGWGIVAFMFCLFYVARKRKETAVLYAVGVSKTKRFGWVFAQSAVLIFAAAGIALAASLPVYGDILAATAVAAEEFTLALRDLTLSDAAEYGMRARMPLSPVPLALYITAAACMILLLTAAGFMSQRLALFKSLNAKKEDG